MERPPLACRTARWRSDLPHKSWDLWEVRFTPGRPLGPTRWLSRCAHIWAGALMALKAFQSLGCAQRRCSSPILLPFPPARLGQRGLCSYWWEQRPALSLKECSWECQQGQKQITAHCCRATPWEIMFLIPVHISFLKSRWHLQLFMGSPYSLGMHLIIGVDYGETCSLDSERAQGWPLWETILGWDQHLILCEVQVFQCTGNSEGIL